MAFWVKFALKYFLLYFRKFFMGNNCIDILFNFNMS